MKNYDWMELEIKSSSPSRYQARRWETDAEESKTKTRIREALETRKTRGSFHHPQSALAHKKYIKPEKKRERGEVGDDVEQNLIITFLSPSRFIFKGVLLTHNASARIIRSNQSLVLQKVTRNSSGNYACSALNSEGETISNQLSLRVKCKHPFDRFSLLRVVHLSSSCPPALISLWIFRYLSSRIIKFELFRFIVRVFVCFELQLPLMNGAMNKQDSKAP